MENKNIDLTNLHPVFESILNGFMNTNKKPKLKLVFTFGVGTMYRQKVVIVHCNNTMQAIDYVFNKYGSSNVAFEYHWDENSLKNSCELENGLFDLINKDYTYGKNLIKKYNYEILEEVTLED